MFLSITKCNISLKYECTHYKYQPTGFEYAIALVYENNCNSLERWWWSYEN